MDDPVLQALSASREELLDLGLRNPLINHRPGRREVRIVDERAAEVHRILVGEGRAMDFLAAPEEGLPDPDTLPQPEADGRPAARHVDHHLQTAHRSAALQARLLHLAQDAQRLIEEQGVNACSLALGELRWQPAGHPEPVRAPLLLVPVTLARANARSRFVVSHAGEEVGVNLSLAARLRADFGVELPTLDADADADAVRAWFGEVAARVAPLDAEVTPDVLVLGLFSFARFLLHRDLDPEAWPADRRPEAHPLVRALLGEGFGPQPAVAAATEPLEIFDTDASQAAALAEVAAGRSLVIEGPPGTGKSQTIANLVAQAVARGQRVLFVAEKMAALEVVARRFRSVGLGPLCLELHSHKSNKRAVLAELERTLALGRPRSPEAAEAAAAERSRAAAQLEAYHAALTTPVGVSGVTPYEAIGVLQGIEGDGLPALPFTPMAGWTRDDFAERRARIEALRARLVDLGVPARHPFAGAERAAPLLPVDEEALAAEIETARAALATLRARATELAECLALPAPGDPASLAELRRAAARAAQAPDLGGVVVESPDWRREAEPIAQALALAGEIHATVRAHPEALPEAWADELLATAAQLVELRRDVAELGEAWWRWLSGRWRAAKRTLSVLCAEPPEVHAERLALLDALLAARRRQQDLRRLAPVAAAVFKTRWTGWQADPGPLVEIAEWLDALHAEVEAGALPRGLLTRLLDPPDPRLDARRAALDEAQQAFEGALATLSDRLSWGAEPLVDLDHAALAERLSAWSTARARLRDLCSYNQLAQACRALGLDALVDHAHGWPEASRRLTDALTRAWFGGLLATAEAERPALAAFDRARHEHQRARFVELDAAAQGHHRAEIARRHFTGLPSADDADVAAQLATLRREMAKRSRHLPIRQLLLDAGEAVQRIKPVFMMSPLSIAKYLAPAGPRFDLVVFDEASQVRPVDALGAVARGAQLVVVGDSKQMPPTRFFERIVDASELEEGEANLTADLESILGLCAAAGAPGRMLRWHYRSRHPSLIATSNHLFYGDGLVLFPSPTDGEDLGLRYRHLPDARYDRGGTRTNDLEARAVAAEVMRHARAHPELTLGVVAFSTAQTDAVVAWMERMRRADAEVEPFFSAHPHEPFFVKNLENVQGDERDVMLVSVGYGRDADGRFVLNLGPLNGRGGERRLNVLITRARRRLEVFTNLEPEDLDLSRTEAQGIAALRTFLAFARDGHLPAAAPEPPPATPLEAAITAALEARGHRIRRQVGERGVAVDLAVVDPAAPDRLRLGIECDGASWQASGGTRERERLRPAVLRGLGWALHRTWSLAWHRDPEGERARIEAALEAAPTAAPPAPRAAPVALSRESGVDPTALTARIELPPLPPYALFAEPIELDGQRLEDLPLDRVVEVLARVVAVEGPMQLHDLARRVATRADSMSAPSQPTHDAVRAAAEAAHADGRLQLRAPFVWPARLDEAPLRDRSRLRLPHRRNRCVPPEEMERALARAIEIGGTAEADTAVLAAATALGLTRQQALGEHDGRPWRAALDRLVASGRVHRHREFVVWRGGAGDAAAPDALPSPR